MAEYGAQRGREYNRPPNYGHASPNQRDAAFSSIFGAAPPPGRSQTMTSQTFQQASPDRAQTMSTQTSDTMQRAPPVRQQMNGYGPSPGGGYQTNGYAQGQQPPNGYGYIQGQRPADGVTRPIIPQQSQQPQPQYLPQPMRQDRRPYGAPERHDARTSPSQQPPYNKPVPHRYPGGPPGAALNSDSPRSHSLASGPRPNFQPQGNSYHVAPAHAFRQQPYMNHLARTTAQGRVVPERPDERAMSMTSHARDAEYAQTMSGRVIPNRRRESAGPDGIPGSDNISPGGIHPPQQPISPPGSKTRTSREGSFSTNHSPRTPSMASTIVSPSEENTSLTLRPGVSKSNSTATQQTQAQMVTQRRAPLVYVALLSRVADTFRELISLQEKEKDGLVYKSAFSGAEAVDLFAYIIKTTDRNLALLLGRSLDAQKFFHDVTYAHRLRDSTSEIYQFRETLVENESEVNGVFTLLTECYSPTCTRDRLCYSIACPRRLEQQARLNIKPQPGLKREDSRTSLHEDHNEEVKLWINTVPKEIADSVPDREKKRQEVISELMYTERDFVKDLEYLRDFWMKPLRTSPSIIPEHRRERFVSTVFTNCQEVYMVNSRLAEALTRRQQQNPVVRNVGDIFLEYVPRFEPFIKYGANQLFGKWEFENEKRTNPAFARFVDETERLKESRKLELNGYLTKPTTRLARYPLLLDNILKYTADDNPDKTDIPKAVAMIREFLSKVNVESGKAENHFNLLSLNRDLKWRPGEYVDLKLTEESRQLIFKGGLKKNPNDQTTEIQAYLFDHALLLVRPKNVNKREEMKVYRRPIPLELLVITQMDEVLPKMGISKRPSSSLIPGAKSSSTMLSTTSTSNKQQQGYPITFKHLGKGGYEITLWCSSQIQQTKWMEHIEVQQRNLREKSQVFKKEILNEGFFTAAIRVNCCVPIDGARKLVFGTDFGVYIADRKPKDASQKPRRVLDAKSVTQIDVLETHSILLVLSDKTLYSYPLDALDPEDGQGGVGAAGLGAAGLGGKRGRKICHANFFKAGVCQGQQLVCAVKTSALSSTVKVYEPMEGMGRSKKKGFAKMLQGGQDVLKPFKEFYIPTESTSIHFLRTKLCVGCARGFEIVSLDTLETQGLLDQADTSLDFVLSRESIKPIHIERLQSEFLLCYTDFSFFVNRNGWRARPEWKIEWEGNPTGFALVLGGQGGWVVAFESCFVEVRRLETGGVGVIERGRNVRLLHASSREILYAYEDEMGEDVIASLDFWGRPSSPAYSRQSQSPDSTPTSTDKRISDKAFS
ncbi:RHO1 GDP-GTP exchange protein 2 [Coniosporium apollinis]|uniref:RHO1 GDP-GTP exchange protein 2 n=1 Tax=Coniosporium apollinis TaxID=61459 RepID=A0ABQ9NPF9_9PEZI|nr:RHO1 GDP-GTP exchange protein 2 [Coniosporium apollinis]